MCQKSEFHLGQTELAEILEHLEDVLDEAELLVGLHLLGDEVPRIGEDLVVEHDLVTLRGVASRQDQDYHLEDTD